MPGRRRSAQLGTLLAVLLLAAGCGTSEPAPLKPMAPEVPADLCATVPAAAKVGLVSNSDSDTTGNPTAACSLRSPDTGKAQVRAVITWTQLDDEQSADEVYDSQCRAIDRTEFTVLPSFTAKGADHVCAAQARQTGVDSATMTAETNRQVITVRLTAQPPGTPPAVQRSQQMLEGVLASMAG